LDEGELNRRQVADSLHQQSEYLLAFRSLVGQRRAVLPIEPRRERAPVHRNGVQRYVLFLAVVRRFCKSIIAPRTRK
jgi:hypothetical protein